MSNRTVTLDEPAESEVVVRRRSRQPLATYTPTEGQVNQIPLAEIRAGDNDRTVFADDKIDELADSIRTTGLAQPITIRPINDPTFLYEIVAGERRFRACQRLKWERIPAIVRKLTDEQAAEIMLAENVHRADLDPIDEARAYQKRMGKFGWAVSQVAKKANVTEKRVNARLLLLNLLPEVQQMIQSDQVGVQFGESMANLDTNRQRIALHYLATTERPLLREFRAIVGRLSAEQAQETFLDTLQSPGDIIRATVAQNDAERAAVLAARRFPVDDRLPLMERTGSIGASFETYLARLLTSDDPYLREAAPIVGRIYDSLLRGGMAYAHGSSPKRKS